ncbi:MAG: hypothetical protein AAF443_00140 [Chlamydiota bacterium]
MWIKFEGEKEGKAYKIGGKIAEGDNKQVWEILGTDFVIFLPVNRCGWEKSSDWTKTGTGSDWINAVNFEVTMSRWLSKLGICNIKSRRVDVFDQEGETTGFPTFVSWSFKALTQKKEWFIIDAKDKKNSTWKNSSVASLKRKTRLRKLLDWYSSGGKAQELDIPKGFLKEKEARDSKEAWKRILRPMVVDIFVMYQNGIVLDRDGSINFVVIPDFGGGYVIRYFGFDFGRSRFHPETQEQKEQEACSIIEQIISAVFKQQTEDEEASIKRLNENEYDGGAIYPFFLKKNYKEMGMVDFFQENFKTIFKNDYENFLNCLKNSQIEKKFIVNSATELLDQKNRVKECQKSAAKMRKEALALVENNIPKNVWNSVEGKLGAARMYDEEAQRIVEKFHDHLNSISDPLERKGLHKTKSSAQEVNV